MDDRRSFGDTFNAQDEPEDRTPHSARSFTKHGPDVSRFEGSGEGLVVFARFSEALLEPEES